VALATGAGKPTILDMPNGLVRGVRQASDFLMALQLTGAGRKDTLANLQLRLPVVVIGGGLTAIDSCTEALAYYPIQVEKFLARYEALVAAQGADTVHRSWNDEDQEIATEFITHAREIRAEREAAIKEGRAPLIRELLDSWGGGTLVYRRRLIDSPAYRNFEEVNKAMEEGIRFAEQLTPVAVETDHYGAAMTMRVKDSHGTEHHVPARSIIVAAGTVPNTTLAREHDGINLNGKYFQAVDEEGKPVTPEAKTKPSAVNILMSVDGLDGQVSFFGDLHPSFAGNVVSAMASAKQGYPIITRALSKRTKNGVGREQLFRTLNDGLHAQVHAVTRLTPTIVEVVVHAPFAAKAFEPGQFYRLQNFEAGAPKAKDTVLAMEGLALTGAWTDVEKGLVGMIVLEMGGSSNLVARLKVGEPVVLMGPTGAPTETPAGETVLLAGGGLGNAVLFSIGRAFRAAGSKVLYFAGYREAKDRFKIEDIEAAADVVVWCVDRGEAFGANRPQDRTFVGNIVEAIAAYGEGKLGEAVIALSDVNRIIAIGSDKMMSALAKARHHRLAPLLKPDHIGVGSINSPMQCMMKEICAQCLQKHRDPRTGKEVTVFTCFNQDQELDHVDFDNLADRLSQNALSEKLTKAWISHCLD
jgi:NAD(P)H-flavin reductase